MVDLSKYLVVTFDTGERTAELTELSFRKLGFKNFQMISGKDGLRSKFFKLAEIACNSEYEYYVQNDADRYVFSGMLDLVASVEKEKTDSSAGIGFDYVMNRFRGATPNVFSKRALVYLHSNKHIMPNVQKPLTAFGQFLGKSPDFIDKDFSIFTNLHDYDQFPSKICNTFLNRLFRNHIHLYNQQHLQNLPDYYKAAIDHAYATYQEMPKKDTIDYIDFSFLDEGFPECNSDDYESMYESHKALYEKLCDSFSKRGTS